MIEMMGYQDLVVDMGSMKKYKESFFVIETNRPIGNGGFVKGTVERKELSMFTFSLSFSSWIVN